MKKRKELSARFLFLKSCGDNIRFKEVTPCNYCTRCYNCLLTPTLVVISWFIPEGGMDGFARKVCKCLSDRKCFVKGMKELILSQCYR